MPISPWPLSYASVMSLESCLGSDMHPRNPACNSLILSRSSALFDLSVTLFYSQLRCVLCEFEYLQNNKHTKEEKKFKI
ncbi:hypothetical protein Hanom_Chr11g01040561 [Helianthus anomalus]